MTVQPAFLKAGLLSEANLPCVVIVNGSRVRQAIDLQLQRDL